ncbi:MAG: cysteine synthase A [Kangiellaceae bacterium]|jgi:cysteine synthase A|nr:cysteine synthase A [Kangiellaceae bacterium]
MTIKQNLSELIGNTDLLKLNTLSEMTGNDIYVKCEFQNPGGSIKDRAALQMVEDAIEAGQLKPGMTIVEGTAGNTGIGLAIVAKSLGFKLLTVMPKGQTPEKERMIKLHGSELLLVDPCPFANPNHFYHTARRLGEENDDYWWANQFENLSNSKAHYRKTGPEIWQQTDGKIDILVSVCGTGGTIGGNSKFLSEQKPDCQTWLIDPNGSGIKSYLETGEYKATGGSFTEGIGIMRSVANFREAHIDKAVTLSDQDAVTISRAVRDQEGLVLGSSAALNVAGALLAAVKHQGQEKTIVTFACDLGERSFSKLYNEEFLADKEIDSKESIDALLNRYNKFDDAEIIKVKK